MRCSSTCAAVAGSSGRSEDGGALARPRWSCRLSRPSRATKECATKARKGGASYPMRLSRRRDGGRPPGAAVQAEAANHPLVLRAKGAVLSEMGKGGTARFRQVWIAESNASEPLRKCRNALRRRQNRGCPPAPGSVREGTCQLPERRPACRRRERNPGSCAERGNLPADAKGEPRAEEPQSGRVPKRRRRGGAARSSEEGSGMELERRGRPGSLGRADNRRYREDRERESTSRPLGWPGRDEPCESRLSRTVLRGPGGEIPPGCQTVVDRSS